MAVVHFILTIKIFRFWRGIFSGYIDGLVQDCSIPSALAMGILQSCTEPSMYGMISNGFARLIALDTFCLNGTETPDNTIKPMQYAMWIYWLFDGHGNWIFGSWRCLRKFSDSVLIFTWTVFFIIQAADVWVNSNSVCVYKFSISDTLLQYISYCDAFIRLVLQTGQMNKKRCFVGQQRDAIRAESTS